MTHLPIEEAKELTEQIRTNVNALAELIRRAHTGRIWEAFNYENFTEWVEKELGWSRTRGLQLLNIALLTEAIADAVSLPNDFELTDNQTRAIIHEGREEFITELKEVATGEPQENYETLISLLKKKKEENGGNNTTTPRTIELPKPTRFTVGEGVRDTKTGLSMNYSVRVQAQNLPSPKRLSPPVITECLNLLGEALTELDKRIEAYEADRTNYKKTQVEEEVA